MEKFDKVIYNNEEFEIVAIGNRADGRVKISNANSTKLVSPNKLTLISEELEHNINEAVMGFEGALIDCEIDLNNIDENGDICGTTLFNAGWEVDDICQESHNNIRDMVRDFFVANYGRIRSFVDYIRQKKLYFGRPIYALVGELVYLSGQGHGSGFFDYYSSTEDKNYLGVLDRLQTNSKSCSINGVGSEVLNGKNVLRVV